MQHSFNTFTKGLNEISQCQSVEHEDVQAYSKICTAETVWRDGVILTAHHDFEDANRKRLVEQLVEQLLEDDMIVFSKEPDFITPEPSTRYRASIRIWDELGFRRKFRSIDFV